MLINRADITESYISLDTDKQLEGHVILTYKLDDEVKTYKVKFSNYLNDDETALELRLSNVRDGVKIKDENSVEKNVDGLIFTQAEKVLNHYSAEINQKTSVYGGPENIGKNDGWVISN